MNDRIYTVKDFGVDRETLFLQETLFHNANGYIGVRGTLEEGVPQGWNTMRGTYLNGFYDISPMKQAELLCNLVEDKEAIVNVCDTQTIKAMIGGEEFSLLDEKTYNTVRTLDMERGFTERSADWQNKDGKTLQFKIRRITSFTEKSLFAVDYQIHSVDYEGEVSFRSLHRGVVENYCNPDDPRLAAESSAHLSCLDRTEHNGASYLLCQTLSSKLKVVSGVFHELYVDGQLQENGEMAFGEEEATFSQTIRIRPGETIRLIKYCIFKDSIRVEDPLKEAIACMETVKANKLDEYYRQQKEYLAKFWDRALLKITGDDDLDASIQFNLYGLLQSAGTDAHASIAAKGLSGEGYEGHYFWDTEMFMLPFFDLCDPQIAKNLLTYRYTILPEAKKNAALLGHKKGALYPWRTITGKECSGYFPSGTAAYHIDGDIAYAVIQYYLCTGDWEFIASCGFEMVLETARLWMDVGHFVGESFHINCVTGPDEYTCMVNNNYFTNACARYNLEWVVRFAEIFRQKEEWKAVRDRLQVSDEELSEMKKAAEQMLLLKDEKTGINPQDDSFLQKPIWKLEETDQAEFPLLLHYHPLHLYRYQVCKQADTVLAHFLFPEYQDRETMEKSFLYYEKITTHDSSLSTCVFSMTASMLGMEEKACTYLGNSAKLDLLNLHRNTGDGIHAANMGGCYMAIVKGFGMLRISENGASLKPLIPGNWEQYSYRFQYLNRTIEVAVSGKGCELTLVDGEAVEVTFYDQLCRLEPGKPVTHKFS